MWGYPKNLACNGQCEQTLVECSCQHLTQALGRFQLIFFLVGSIIMRKDTEYGVDIADARDKENVQKKEEESVQWSEGLCDTPQHRHWRWNTFEIKVFQSKSAIRPIAIHCHRDPWTSNQFRKRWDPDDKRCTKMEKGPHEVKDRLPKYQEQTESFVQLQRRRPYHGSPKQGWKSWQATAWRESRRRRS